MKFCINPLQKLFCKSLVPWAMAVAIATAIAMPVAASEAQAWKALKQGGHIVLFRHANAPGGGDPMAVTVGDCTTQRNLDAAGRAQSVTLGDRFRAHAIQIDALWSSQWCRTRDTATLAFPMLERKDEVAFNSFFANPERALEQTNNARRLLLNWRGAGNLIVVTHQVNITQLTEIFPASGEGIVLKKVSGQLFVVGGLRPTEP